QQRVAYPGEHVGHRGRHRAEGPAHPEPGEQRSSEQAEGGDAGSRFSGHGGPGQAGGEAFLLDPTHSFHYCRLPTFTFCHVSLRPSQKKTPLINENLRKCLSSKDGRLVASLVLDFLQVFNLDFSLAVFQPEINALNGLDGRDPVCRELGLSDSELNRNSPVLLELVRRARQKDDPAVRSQELSQNQIGLARRTFDAHDKDQSGSVREEDLKSVFTDLLPGLNKNMLERFVDDELRAADNKIDFQAFLAMYKRLFAQCRSVVVSDSEESRHQTKNPEEKPGSPPVSKEPERVLPLPKRNVLQQNQMSPAVSMEHLDLDLDEGEDHDEGDSFFDDPLPKPQKTYGWKAETSGARASPVGSVSEVLRPAGGSSGSEPSHSRNGVKISREKNLKGPSDRTGSLQLDEDVEYDDDFNSHRSDLSNGELSIGEEIEEVSIEGPEISDKVGRLL
uniref:Centrosomal protein 43 n=1 Tax=Fundulus heteroclitus TaxID=8078 RepID=A0A3Q2QCH9_FUNHE